MILLSPIKDEQNYVDDPYALMQKTGHDLKPDVEIILDTQVHHDINMDNTKNNVVFQHVNDYIDFMKNGLEKKWQDHLDMISNDNEYNGNSNIPCNPTPDSHYKSIFSLGTTLYKC